MPLDRKRGKGGKFKKNRKRKVYLSADDLQFLVENTKYEKTEVEEWFRYAVKTNPIGAPWNKA